MAFNENQIQKIEQIVNPFIESIRPAPEIRQKMDISFRLENQSLLIFEIRPQFRYPDRVLESSIAKATYVKRTRLWKLYWMRADMKWHRYEPFPGAESLQEILDVIARDEYHCFWG